MTVARDGLEHWLPVSLDNVGKLFCGQSSSRKDVNSTGEGVPYVSGPEQWDGFVLRIDKWTATPRREVPTGCIFITVKGAGVGKIFPGVACAIGRDIYAYKPHVLIDWRFIEYALRHQIGEVVREARGDIPGLSRSHILGHRISIPSALEQQAIAAKVEALFSELDAGVAQLEAARALLKRYRQSVLKAAFEGRLTAEWREFAKRTPVSKTLSKIEQPPRPNRWKTRSRDIILGHASLAVGNPKSNLPDGWSWVALADVARMESGHTPSKSRDDWWNGDIPWVGIADARQNNGSVIHTTAKQTNEDGLDNSAARLLPTGTVCISRTASVGYVVELGKPMATSQDFVNWVPTNAVASAWLRLVFGCGRETLTKFGKGTTHTTIYFPEWLSVHIALPPIEEQLQIVREVEALWSTVDSISQAVDNGLIQSKALRQSILKRAFEGRLLDESELEAVRSDPDYEPAEKLLERIRAQSEAAKPAKKKAVRKKRSSRKTQETT